MSRRSQAPLTDTSPSCLACSCAEQCMQACCTQLQGPWLACMYACKDLSVSAPHPELQHQTWSKEHRALLDTDKLTKAAQWIQHAQTTAWSPSRALKLHTRARRQVKRHDGPPSNWERDDRKKSGDLRHPHPAVTPASGTEVIQKGGSGTYSKTLNPTP